MATRLHDKTADRRGYGSLLDDSSRYPPPPSPDAASLWSRLFFSYATPVIDLGNTRQLDASDLWETTTSNQAERVSSEFKTAYERSQKRLFHGIVRAYGVRVALCGLGGMVDLASTLFAPVVLHHVIDAFARDHVDLEDLSFWLVAFFGLRIIGALATAQVGFHISQLMIRLTVAIRTMLFEKALRRVSKRTPIEASREGDAENGMSATAAPPADLANLLTADVNNLLGVAHQINSIWVVPVQIVGVMVLLYNLLGVAALAGLVVVFLSIFLGGKIATLSGKAFGDLMQRKDKRMQVVKEVFGAIQVVKLNAWESKFTDRILSLRNHELQAVWRTHMLAAVSSFVLWGSPLLVSVTTFAVYTLVLEQQLTAAKVFTSMALFGSLRTPLTSLPRVFAQCLQAKIALDRMQVFLDTDEFDNSNVCRDGSAYPADVAVDVANGSFGWTEDNAVLKNIDLTIKKGDFVIVHGPVGAGKSSLCLALLGEMEKLSGTVFVRGRVAYYSQQTWIRNQSIRDNILFGKAYDDALYKRVLDACGLVTDLEQFSGGDQTEIGHNGVNLSGGQKARLCLARACYADADVLILDSPLSAVDALVQAEIFNKCMCDLLESKTVILVTHSPDMIASDAANYKIEITNGVARGERRDPVKPRRSFMTPVSPKRTVTGENPSGPVLSDKKSAEASRLVDDEKRESGRVSKTVFLAYSEALGGVRAWLALAVILFAWQASQIASDVWLSRWTGQKGGEYDESATKYNMLVYAGLCVLSAVLVLGRSTTTALVALRGARYLFEVMTRTLLRAPLRFFDANPIGRIINRYGDDVNAVDFFLPMCLAGVLTLSIFIIGQLGTAVATVKLLGVLVLPLIYIYVKTTTFYLEPSREVNRLVKVSDSPVLSFVTVAERGVVTLRAFGVEHVDDATRQVMTLINANSRTEFAQNVMAEWFELRIQLVGCGILIVVVSALVYLHETLSPGMIGLAFTYTLNIQMQLIQLVGIWSYLETCMISPERILEYAAIPPEGEHQLLQIEPSPMWPQRGTIDFDNVVFTYKEGAPPVLKGLSFSIKNNEKIGIVGRTGAGKSSLTMALFRINELVSGRVSIDGVDISTMPLQSLRSRLSIIPQSPVLFKGPLRAYMDPFDEYTDEEIWTVFEKVEMKEQIVALEGQLSHELSENGENFSVGERQMLCMARAMLTKSRIVVMDEATASIDHATEKKLQQMINRDFQEATVLTIAHRLATVLDSDRIMVMSEGRVVEFDTPANLVKNTDGIFYALAKEGDVLEKIVDAL